MAAWIWHARSEPEEAARNSKLPSGSSPGVGGRASVQVLCALYEKKVLDLTNPRLSQDLDAVFDGLVELSRSRDSVQAAQARLMRYIFAAELSSYLIGIGNDFAMGFVPPGAMRSLRGTRGGDEESLLVPFYRISGVVLVAARKMGANVPEGPSLTTPAKDQKTFERQVAIVRALFPKLWGDWVREVGSIPDGQLGELAMEKAATVSFLTAAQTNLAEAKGLRQMAAVTVDYPRSRWADDVECACLMISIYSLRRFVTRGGMDKRFDEMYEAIVDYTGVRSEWKKISESTGPVKPGAREVALGNALTAKYERFLKRWPNSPWRPNVELAMENLRGDRRR